MAYVLRVDLMHINYYNIVEVINMSQKLDPKTGKWYYYGAYVDKEDGTKHQYKKRGFASKREASKAEGKFRDDIDAGVIIKKSKTFEKIAHDFMQYSKKKKKESTYITNMQTLSIINAKIGKTEINKLNTKVLQKFIDELDNKLSKNYVQKIYYLINQIFNYAVEHNYLLTNPLRKVARNERKNEMHKKMEFWEPEHFNKFISVVDDDLYKSFFTFLYYMGCRRGEALALSWKDIDFNSNTVTINKTISVKTTPYKITPPKTKNSNRTITMPRIVIINLKHLKTEAMKIYAYDDKRFVFGYIKPLLATSISRHLKDYIKLANEQNRDKIPVIRLHDLRHSHASYLINNMSAGFTDFDIAKRLGDTVATLHDTYAHWFKHADKNIIDFMDTNIN